MSKKPTKKRNFAPISPAQARAGRALTGLDRAAFAERAGISQWSVWQIENGRLEPSRRVATRFRVTLENLGVRCLDADEWGGEGARLILSRDRKASGEGSN